MVNMCLCVCRTLVLYRLSMTAGMTSSTHSLDQRALGSKRTGGDQCVREELSRDLRLGSFRELIFHVQGRLSGDGIML